MARICIKHRMSDGTIMEGPIHGLGQECIEYKTGKYNKGGKIKNPRYKGSGKKTAKDYSAGGKYSVGGMLVGPSHEEGGISAIVDGTEPIEVEGGEFVINKKTVDAVGSNFLHKLNHTNTPYHDPATGYQSGQLPSPSNYKKGGKLLKNNLQSKVNIKKGLIPPKKVKMREGGGIYNGESIVGVKKTNRTRPVIGNSKMREGGFMGSVHLNTPNKICRDLISESSCKFSKHGCRWNPSTSMCE